MTSNTLLFRAMSDISEVSDTEQSTTNLGLVLKVTSQQEEINTKEL